MTASTTGAATMPNSLDATMPRIFSEALTDLLAHLYAMEEHINAFGADWQCSRKPLK
jgi:hypothetical protein